MGPMNRTRIAGPSALLATAAATAALAMIACGGNNVAVESPPAPSASVAASPSTAPPATSEAPAPAPSAAPEPATSATAVLGTDSNSAERIFEDASKAPPATLKGDGIKAHGDALAKGVLDLAKKAAPGMKPEGPLATGTVAEKQHLQTDITFHLGKCYTVVGYSKTVKDLDLHLLLSPGILSAQDTTDDGNPVVGRAPDPVCMMAGSAVTYKLDIFADEGGGDVAVQVFSKDQPSDVKPTSKASK